MSCKADRFQQHFLSIAMRPKERVHLGLSKELGLVEGTLGLSKETVRRLSRDKALARQFDRRLGRQSALGDKRP
jgi:hypothetical protein